VNIVFDLDGTLIDSRLRLYRLFQNLVPSSSLSYGTYWRFKKNKISNEQILISKFNYNQFQINDFVARWLQLIESPEYLALDCTFEGICTALTKLKNFADLHVCTARQSRQPVLDQLEKFGLQPFFKNILVTESAYDKETLIAAHIYELSRNDWFIGDTGYDIQTGKRLNMSTCAVLTGFLNRSNLKKYHPDLITDSVISFSVLAGN